MMTVSLKPEIQRYIDEKVRRGDYASAEEAVNKLLEIFASPARLPSGGELDELRSKIAAGVDQANRGELEEWDAAEIWAEAERRFADGQGKRAG